MNSSHNPVEILEKLNHLRPKARSRIPSWVAAACLSCGMATACTTPAETPTTPDSAGPQQPMTPDEPDSKKGVDMYAAPDDGMSSDMDVCHECMEYAAPAVAEYGGPPMEDE
ncbi:hypothetical protein KJ975_11995 [Myxococcota bacterium]|nr:hypothetical protein [Myxococcota bacterium]